MENIAEKEEATGKEAVEPAKVSIIPLQVKLRKPLVDRLKRLAFNADRTNADIVDKALEAYLPGAEEGVAPR